MRCRLSNGARQGGAKEIPEDAGEGDRTWPAGQTLQIAISFDLMEAEATRGDGRQPLVGLPGL
jgi:hypothetical protein